MQPVLTRTSRAGIVLLSPRNYFGEEVGYYVAFLNALLMWLLPPALVSTWLAYALRNQRAPGGTAAGEEEDQLLGDSQEQHHHCTMPPCTRRYFYLTNCSSRILPHTAGPVPAALHSGWVPLLSLLLVVWGGIGLKLWARRSARLAWRWDVHVAALRQETWEGFRGGGSGGAGSRQLYWSPHGSSHTWSCSAPSR